MKLKKFRVNQIIIALLLLTGAAVTGLTDYISAGFDFTVFLTATFWVNIITTNVGTLCIILSILLMKVDKFKLQDENYKTVENKITDFYNNNFVATVFRKYCDYTNRKLKINSYKDRIYKRFAKVKPKAKDIEIFNHGTDEEKANNKYVLKYRYYKNLLSDEYINEVIDKMYVRYNSITDGLVFSGIKATSTSSDYITKHKALKVSKDLLPKYVISFGISLILASVVPDLKDGVTLAMIFKTITKIFVLCSQIYFAINYGDNYCQEVILHDIRFRYNVVTDYNIWLMSKANSLNQNKKEEIIEPVTKHEESIQLEERSENCG